jgi:phosphate transport system substrate-binding protein
MKRLVFLLSVSLLALQAAGCGQAKQRLNGGGSSFVYPMMSKWASEYDKIKGVEINYQSIGSGGGIQQMTAKTFDFGCTDAPMNDDQLKKAKGVGGDAIHVPLVMGAVVIIYNVSEVKEPLVFTGPVLADIYLGKITKWNDAALKKLNPAAALPDKEIAVVHRSDGSGTTYIFSDYLSQVSDGWKKIGKATSLNWPRGSGGKGSEGVTGQVKDSPGSIGYVELIYALQNKIPFGLMQNKEGATIKGSLESVTAAADAALKKLSPEELETLRYSIVNADGKESYPISGTVWAVIYKNQPTEKGKAIVDYLRWITHEGQPYAKELDYAQLPKSLVERIEKKLGEVNFVN